MVKTQKKAHKNLVKGTGISFFILLLVYLGMSVYFRNHFYFGTVINNTNVSGKTVDEVNKKIGADITSYVLELEGRSNIKEKIAASDIDLKYNPKGKIKELKDSQNPFKWVFGPFNKKNYTVSEIVSYNEEKLKKSMDKLAYFNNKNVVQPKDATLKYKSNGYEIVNEIYGSKVNKGKLYSKVKNAIISREKTVNLESSDCYENPKYTSKSKEVMEAKKVLDKYVSSKITYDAEGKVKVLDGSTINNWLEVDKDLKVKVNEDKVRNYVVTNLGPTYNTIGRSRNFNTSTGKTVRVNGGNYGWIINRAEEVKDIISSIKNGQTISKQPKYIQTAVSHDDNNIGNTYVEINLTKQHMWFYKNGALVVEGDIVTGNVSNNNDTPEGTYILNYKERNATLRGENYSTKVSFWMPFNGGIGIHDATWRKKFGGAIYRNDGSHGCVNSPPYLAEAIFNNIKPGTPIVCYFE